MTFKKGEKIPGQGKRGPNKLSSDVKAMLMLALKHAGGAEYLFTQAFDNPKAFLALVGRVLPLQLTGEDGGPVQLTPVTLSDEQLLEIASRVKSRAKLGYEPDA